jgi:hypothetical protein
VVPQLDAAWAAHATSLVPAFAGPHWPLAPLSFSAAEHAWHGPVHAELQQTPSTQNVFVAHSFAPEHVAPRSFFGAHVCEAVSQ